MLVFDVRISLAVGVIIVRFGILESLVSCLIPDVDMKSPEDLNELKAQARKELEDEKKVKKRRNVAKIGKL